MAWRDVKIKISGEEFDAKMRGNEIFVPMTIEDQEFTIEVDGEPREVESVRVDDRDGVVYITVKADAKEQSDDEPAEGRNDDNDGGDSV
tara:strand:+ start:655 stop:921 length:267 start_codon:yes stop_codon:yes gene_type:complete